MVKKTTEQFIEDAKKVHGDRYDYSLVDYVNSRTKVKIICQEHGIFEQEANSHISSKQGCPLCKGGIKMTENNFINIASDIHNNKYDYSMVDYINSHKKVKIICK